MTTETALRNEATSARLTLRSKMALLLAAGLTLLFLAVTLSISLGSARIPFATVWSIALHRIGPDLIEPFWNAGRENIVWNLRFPRALLAAIVGAGLGMAGAAIQGTTRNPLADPHLLGVSAGAALGANVAILLVGNVFGPATVPLFAFAGALFATALIIGIAGLSPGTDRTQLVLAGVAISFIISAAANLVIMFADPRAIASVIFWMMGGFGLAQWSNLLFPLTALIIAGFVFIINARSLNALAMGDESATTLGVPVTRLRLILIVASAFITGVLVAFSGMIGFVGLMMPHIARLLVGGDNRLVLPASAVLGAIFLVLADIIARTLTAPNDIPIGIVTGFIGGLFFLAMLVRRRSP
ncbi:ABC transporter permease [Phyllobacterium phragmitis]|uniref:ABC transporter permease n=1 Tax=Phyllobacterium phragmitis TaxID=2670329 RepID=A0A2S9IWD2_9HYPH|nr:iron ABC transporter permease [Phyllobacterium phragmitis]PRD44833.1 ABC transporter permease [Phyllobacterium phragmitis]